MTKVAIIGGGISGCSIANILNSKGFESILFEKNKLGGLVACTFEAGHTYHRVGGHVFNSKAPEVLDWFWNHFDKENEFLLAKRNAVIYLNNEIISYPIELNLSQLPAKLASCAIREILDIANDAPTSLCFENFEDFLRKNFGNTLCDLYFSPYNRKIWHRDLATIPLAWLDGKLPMISPAEIIEKNILKLDDNMVHSHFYYPRRGGSQFIIDRLADRLTIEQEQVTSIHYDDHSFKINKNPSEYQTIVYTGDIRQIPDILSAPARQHVGLNEELCDQLKTLDANGTTTMLCECAKTDYSWVYLPGLETRCHRIIMTGNFSPENSAAELPADRTTCTVEYSGYLCEDEMRCEVSKLPFAMQPIAYNYCENSYIIHDQATASLMQKATTVLASHGIFCCGRFAEWQYYNMDAAISSAFNVASQLANYAN
jgi:protoporphyrinogen oxidase